MAQAHVLTGAHAEPAAPAIRRIGPADLFDALARGWEDFAATPSHGGARGPHGRNAATAQRGVPAVVVSPPPTVTRNVFQDGRDRVVYASASAMRAAPAASGCAGSERRTTRPNSAIEV